MKRKAVLITGGARRVGAVMALYFAGNGYDIALHYNRSKGEAEKLKKKIEAKGAACKLFAGDLSKVKTIPKLMAAVKKAMPHCTALVNNASVFEKAEFMETTEAIYDRQMDVNLKACFFTTQAFARVFGRGVVINLCDSEAMHHPGSHFAYLLAKKGLYGLTMMTARALGPKIRVNAVAPGIILPSNELDTAYMKKLAGTLPLKATGTPDQVAEAAYMLCENSHLTGQVIFADGGQHLL